MEYILIIILQVIGCGFHVGQKVLELDKKFPDDTLKEVWDIFIKSDRVTLIMSGLVLSLNLVAHLIIDLYAPSVHNSSIQIPLIDGSVPYIIAAFILAFVLGYAGQRVVYKWLGKAEDILNKRLETKNV